MMPANNYRDNITWFENGADQLYKGWVMNVEEFTVNGQIIAEDYTNNKAVMLSNYPFISLPSNEFNYLLDMLPNGTDWHLNTYGQVPFYYT